MELVCSKVFSYIMEKCPGTKGDVLRFRRGTRWHYAVQTGDTTLVHVVEEAPHSKSGSKGTADNSPSLTHRATSPRSKIGHAVILEETYDNVRLRMDSDATVEDTVLAKPFSAEEIVRRAHQYVGESYEEFVSDTDYRHFTTWCRFGKLESLGGKLVGKGTRPAKSTRIRTRTCMPCSRRSCIIILGVLVLLFLLLLLLYSGILSRLCECTETPITVVVV